jgi:hypothetical protein
VIQKRGNRWRVVVQAGRGPLSGKRRQLSGSAATYVVTGWRPRGDRLGTVWGPASRREHVNAGRQLTPLCGRSALTHSGVGPGGEEETARCAPSSARRCMPHLGASGLVQLKQQIRRLVVYSGQQLDRKDHHRRGCDDLRNRGHQQAPGHHRRTRRRVVVHTWKLHWKDHYGRSRHHLPGAGGCSCHRDHRWPRRRTVVHRESFDRADHG